MVRSNRCLILSPIGGIAPWILEALEKNLPGIFNLPVQVVPLLSDINFAYDMNRNQYHSTRVLEELEARCPDQGVKILGITKEDLFIPILTHVYGEAQLGGRASIISISRLLIKHDHLDFGKERLVKEAVHELGHCFDLRHCQDSFCIMHYCRKLADVDKKSLQFCRYCRILLQDAMTYN